MFTKKRTLLILSLVVASASCTDVTTEPQSSISSVNVFSEAASYQPKDGNASAPAKRKRYVRSDPQRPLETADRPAGRGADDEGRQRQAETMNDPIPF